MFAMTKNMKRAIAIISFIIIQNIFGQVTFVVEAPKENLNNTSIYISGDFEGWTGGQEVYQLSQKKELYFITLPKQKGEINFKFTQGSWDSVETNIKGLNIANRLYVFNKLNDTIKLKIASWNYSDVFTPKKHTVLNNVFVLPTNFEIPQLNRTRKIWIYFPPNYHNSNTLYPVLYMHDGQNLFDAATSFSGEWQVDETLNKLYEENGFELIVIGIDNGGEKRLDEYSPWKNEKYGGGEGVAYVDFLVKTLKPFVDKNYRTLTDRESTLIMGSSMGGLISYYAALKYSNVFGKAGLFSPALWFSNESFKLAKEKGNLKETKMYFLAGDREGDNVKFEEINQTVSDMNKVVTLLKDEGFTSDNIFTKVVSDGKHNEELWRNNFEEAILWLLAK